MTNSLGYMINYYRKSLNLTLEELGAKLNKSPSAISRWISGERSPVVEDLIKLTMLFETDLNTLLHGINEIKDISQQVTNDELKRFIFSTYNENQIFIRLTSTTYNATIPENSIVSINPTPFEQFKQYDLICIYENENYHIKHLLIDNEQQRYIFKCNSNDPFAIDSIYPFSAFNQKMIVGKVTMHITQL